MNKILKFLGSSLAMVAIVAACSPEEFDGANQGGIPTASGVSLNVSVDQETNQATITPVGMPSGTYPMWVLDGADKYSTAPVFNYTNAVKGHHDVEMYVCNKNGISQGHIDTDFEFEHTIIDFDKYYSNIAREWRIDFEVQGHLGCGEPGSDGSNWWSAKPSEKEDWGVYDDRITFTKEKAYTYSPGADGKVYVNKDVTYWPEFNTEVGDDGNPIDFNATVEAQKATYQIAAEGEKLVLILADKTLFPYIPSDAQYNVPKFTISKISNTELILLYEGDGIVWRYVLTSKAQAVENKFTGYNPTSEFNLWKSVDPKATFYFNPGWAENDKTADMEATYKGGSNKYSLTVPEACADRWQAQFQLHSGITLDASKHYDVSVVFNSDVDIEGVTLKITNEADEDVLLDEAELAIKGGQLVYYKSDIEGVGITDLKVVFDFGHAAEATQITISNIVIKDHANDDGTVLPGGDEDQSESGVVPESAFDIAVDSSDNLGRGFNTKGEMGFWWADAGWGQVSDPGFSYKDGVYTITAVENGGAEWQGQCSINGVPLKIEKGVGYDVYIKINASDDLDRFTAKVNKDPDEANDPNALCYNGSFKLTKGVNYIFFQNVVAKNGPTQEEIEFDQAKLIFDFGGAPAGFVAEISDIVVVKHGFLNYLAEKK